MGPIGNVENIPLDHAKDELLPEMGPLFITTASTTIMTIFRKLISLAFVPSQDVIKSFEDLAVSQFYQQHEEILCLLMDYIEDNWIGRRSRGNRRKPPTVSLEMWNQCEGTLAGLPKINNYIESSLKKFSFLVGCYHPSIWSFIEKLKKSQNIEDLSITQLIAKRDVRLERNSDYFWWNSPNCGKIHIPTEDEDTSLCHNCYKELDDNGSTNNNYKYELFESTEKNAEDPEMANHSIEELETRSDTGESYDDQDADQLYEFYMSEKGAGMHVVAGRQGSIVLSYARHALNSHVTTARNHSLTVRSLLRVAAKIEAVSVEDVGNEDEANEEVVFEEKIISSTSSKKLKTN
ncbi:hypothetical protein ILUMI_26826 [Ignelater luminosus]|uniref:Uncharacterized protein n=1 Tax=Ignelater luminosus TaxID=2038154 RepID=A0A8K0C613_IGNLU|nr:hypothetical protein ILUMI_26826 [Ignelater luminosus]